MSDVATQVKIAKDSLDILSQVFTLGSDISKVSKILKISGKLASSFPVVGAVLGLIGEFLPDAQHEEILSCFKELSNKIDHVRDDIKELKNAITWEITALQYGDDVSRIQKGMKYWSEIVKATAKDEKMRYQARLKELCANQNYTLSLDKLFDGVIGNELFKNSILGKFYEKTEGDRPRISALATRLLQMICGGMLVIATYETLMRGKKGAVEVTKSYDSRLIAICTNVQRVFDKCEANFRENMLNDLNKKLDKGGSNESLVIEVSDLMRDKYDWLENFCIVYNDLQGFDKHCFSGNEVSSLHRSGKCGIVFFRTKGEPHRFSNRFDEAYKIVDEVRCGDAQEAYNNIVAKLRERGIEWTGCAVLTRSPDLGLHRTFSTTYVGIQFSFKISRGRAGSIEYKVEKLLLLK